jgi:hypothetical protein
MSDYRWRIKDGLVWLVTEEDFDLPIPAEAQVAELKSRIVPLVGHVTKLTPDHVLDRLIREGAGNSALTHWTDPVTQRHPTHYSAPPRPTGPSQQAPPATEV